MLIMRPKNVWICGNTLDPVHPSSSCHVTILSLALCVCVHVCVCVWVRCRQCPAPPRTRPSPPRAHCVCVCVCVCVFKTISLCTYSGTGQWTEINKHNLHTLYIKFCLWKLLNNSWIKGCRIVSSPYPCICLNPSSLIYICIMFIIFTIHKVG